MRMVGMDLTAAFLIGMMMERLFISLVRLFRPLYCMD
jgi:hypothetical protein